MPQFFLSDPPFPFSSWGCHSLGPLSDAGPPEVCLSHCIKIPTASGNMQLQSVDLAFWLLNHQHTDSLLAGISTHHIDLLSEISFRCFKMMRHTSGIFNIRVVGRCSLDVAMKRLWWNMRHTTMRLLVIQFSHAVLHGRKILRLTALLLALVIRCMHFSCGCCHKFDYRCAQRTVCQCP